MKWAILAGCILVACSGDAFSGLSPNDGAPIMPPDTGNGGAAAGAAGQIPTPAAGSAGDGGEPGMGGAAGQSGSDSGGTGGEAPIDCTGVLHWTSGCQSDTPITQIVYDGALYAAPKGPTDCNWRCPPAHIREEFCDSSVYVYEYIGEC